MTKSVRDAMTGDPRSIGTSAAVVEAARLMREAHIGSRLIGIVAQAHIALTGNETKTGELVEAISEPSVAERR